MEAELKDKVKMPAMFLIAAGIINLLFGGGQLLFLTIIHLIGIGTGGYSQVFKNGQLLPFLVGQTFAYIMLIIGTITAPVIIYGGWQMLKFRSYKIAFAAAIIGMVPLTSACCLFSLPVGIWCLITLGKPEIKANFSTK